MLQLADYVSHAAFQLYEHRDPSLIKPILGKFDQKNGTIHGLVHVTRDKRGCGCPACASRRSPASFGTWL